MAAKQPAFIPILTDAIGNRHDDVDAVPSPLETDAPAPAGSDAETLIVELQTRIAAGAYELTDEILRSALADMQAKLYRQISSRLRQELPELIDTLLREQLERDRDA
jgi:hypothetical protein